MPCTLVVRDEDVSPPEVLEPYFAIGGQGLVDRTFEFIEGEKEHRHEMNRKKMDVGNKILDATGRWYRIGLCISTFLVVLLIAAETFLSYTGHDTVSGAIFVITIGVVLTRVYKGISSPKKTNKIKEQVQKENENKADSLDD